MVSVVLTTTAAKTAGQLAELDRRIVAGRSHLLRLVGAAARDDVQARMNSRNRGQWRPSSKWLIAKGKPHPLAGLANLVKSRVVGNQGQVYAELPPSTETGAQWSLTQHHKGFENDKPKGNLVVIPVRVPSALGLSDGRKSFGFIHRNAGQTPARQIWPTDTQLQKVAEPIASRWLNQLVKRL
jgi:hypothetical protein